MQRSGLPRFRQRCRSSVGPARVGEVEQFDISVEASQSQAVACDPRGARSLAALTRRPSRGRSLEHRPESDRTARDERHARAPSPASPADSGAHSRANPTTEGSASSAAQFGAAHAPSLLGSFSEEVRRVASSDVTLLIEGETGSGKNLAARLAHAESARSRAPYVEIQLTALTPTLLESELFGHEAGAFTGATEARTGRLLRAQSGTLVLDGIECLPAALQVKLLRVLQERAVEPIGAEAAIPLDARVIALSGRDLEGEMRAGRFREDLYYRLAVVRLRVPPLRARATDLPDLCRHFLALAARRAGVRERSTTSAALDRLLAHAWPGNLRELENALERVSILVPDASAGSRANDRAVPPIDAAELAFLDEPAEGMADEIARQVLAHGVGLEDLERALLAHALVEQRGNVSAAARRLGLGRHAFEHRFERANEGARARGDETRRG
jgi:DNA-binding NtrC family response regulator